MFENIRVIKRDGKKVDFDGTKIAIAIKKGFDSVNIEGEEPKYTENDTNKVYNLVGEEIAKLNPEKIRIEEIQDLMDPMEVSNVNKNKLKIFSSFIADFPNFSNFLTYIESYVRTQQEIRKTNSIEEKELLESRLIRN